MTHDAVYESKQLEKLVGAKITGVVTTPDEQSFGLTVLKNKKTYHVWIDSDQEGNACGAVKIEEVK